MLCILNPIQTMFLMLPVIDFLNLFGLCPPGRGEGIHFWGENTLKSDSFYSWW